MRSLKAYGPTFLLLLAAACGSSSESDGGSSACPDGSETCACYGNGTCNEGLTCLSDLCVEADGSGVGGGSAGEGSGGGANPSGGADSGGTGGEAGGSDGGTGAGTGGASGGTDGNTGGASGGTGATTGGSGGSASGGAGGSGGSNSACGDHVLSAEEACDDGNFVDGDGCSADCEIEDGFSCPGQGKKCIPFARCGDGLVVWPEQCDDGNVGDGDGCSASCVIEGGYECSGAPSDCDATTCGDALVEGAEGCDDGNSAPFDGCSSTCEVEPDCSGASCASECGDGIVLNEECDDGNTRSGDGCSATCQTEAGYVCAQKTACSGSDPACVVEVPAIFRDFSGGDFSASCGLFVQGIVQDTLDASGKPQLKSSTNACIASASSFQQWFGAAPGSTSTTYGAINLFPSESGAFVNRLNNAGDRYTRSGGAVTLDGNPLFFPLPLPVGEAGIVAKIPEEVYGGGWLDDPSGIERNFAFSSELTYWFKFDTTKTATLAFTGDDDVWVFVNGHLAIDLGGLHVPLEGHLAIKSSGITVNTPNPTNTANRVESTKTLATFGLQNGGIYEIKVFQAERKPTGSSFKLSLDGFGSSGSVCTPLCGDGIVGLGEECDEGANQNDGGYGECQPGCKLGEYCGDGIKQEPEECDDGNRDNGDDCDNACRSTG